MRVVSVNYRQYLDSPEWGRKRLDRLEFDNFECSRCHAKERLQVHHVTYERLGAERLDDLRTLCEPCHSREHGKDPELPSIGGPGQRELTARGEAKYWLERWQTVVEKATAVDRALLDLKMETRECSKQFDTIRQMLTVIMAVEARNRGREWVSVMGDAA